MPLPPTGASIWMLISIHSSIQLDSHPLGEAGCCVSAVGTSGLCSRAAGAFVRKADVSGVLLAAGESCEVSESLTLQLLFLCRQFRGSSAPSGERTTNAYFCFLIKNVIPVN